MNPIPTTLAESLPSELRSEAESWWQALADADRNELTRLCDARKNLFLFETFSNPDNSPEATDGKFIPSANEFGVEHWDEDYFQHLLDHPELMILHDPAHRTFHIGCSPHTDARRCFVDGAVSKSFGCPFGAQQCSVYKLLGD